MGYSEALEQQVRLASLYAEAEKRDSLLSGIVKAEGYDDVQARRWVVAMQMPLSIGETYYWSPALCNVLQSTASMLPDWICDTSVFLSAYGFCWFAQPIALPGQGDPLRAIGWSDVYQDADGQSMMPIPMPGKPPAPSNMVLVSYYYEHDGQVIPNATYPLRDGESIFTREFYTPASGTEQRSAAKLKLFAAVACLMAQRILVAPSHRAERHAVKRLERAGWTHEPLVRVVELRRNGNQSKPSGDSKAIAWTHQWVVSGHWRQQPYPSKNIVQPRWIMPYVKGPESAPLKPPRAKVFAVVR